MSLMLLQFADSKSNLAFWKLGIDIIDIAHVRRKVPFMTMMQQLKVYCNYKDRMVDNFFTINKKHFENISPIFAQY